MKKRREEVPGTNTSQQACMWRSLGRSWVSGRKRVWHATCVPAHQLLLSARLFVPVSLCVACVPLVPRLCRSSPAYPLHRAGRGGLCRVMCPSTPGILWCVYRSRAQCASCVVRCGVPGRALPLCLMWVGGLVSRCPRRRAVGHTPPLACICTLPRPKHAGRGLRRAPRSTSTPPLV